MNKKKLWDFLLSCFLISTLGIATFMVSCSEQDNMISPVSNGDGSYNPHAQSGILQSAITATFETVGEGAAGDLGSVGMGWVLGAMGLTSSSGPNWQEEFNKINDDLQQIITLLNSVDEELIDIENTLNAINCSEQQTSLQSDLAAIQTQYIAYSSIALTASQGDTISNAVMLSFSNDVINGTSTQVSIENALNNIYVNAGGVIQSCLPVIQPPASGTYAQDTTYYAQAYSLLNNYYYYQTIGLGLLSEAYHYKAWVAAGSPGGSQGYSSDSVQLVCSANSNATLLCNNVVTQSNTVYNSLLTQFKFTGAQYTGDDLLYQKNTSGQEFVWVKSLEDFTQQSGANCNFPLTSVATSSNDPTCGPTAGIVGSVLSYTTYSGAQNFKNTGFYELYGLVNPLPNLSGSQAIYTYLESLGFENMNNKILIADTLIKIKSNVSNGWYFLDTMHIVPFIVNASPEFINYAGVKKAMYSDANDFVRPALAPTSASSISNSPCADNTAPAIKVNWIGDAAGPPSWLLGSGYQKICEYTQYTPPEYVAMSPFTWNSTSQAPGWSYYQINSNPRNAYFIPVRTDFSGSTGCLPGYQNVNSAGVITICGEDFQEYLNFNLPVPPTCSIPNSIPCTVLP